MASLPTDPHGSVFVGSSVRIAAAISPAGSARVLLRAVRGVTRLALSQLVLDETERNLRKKAPSAVPVFELLCQVLPVVVIDPPAPWSSA